MNIDPFEDPSLVTPSEAAHEAAIAPFEDASHNIQIVDLGKTVGVSGAIEVNYVGDPTQQAADKAAVEAVKAEQPGNYGQAGSR